MPENITFTRAEVQAMLSEAHVFHALSPTSIAATALIQRLTRALGGAEKGAKSTAPSCKTCRFWKGSLHSADMDMGYCRRYPPRNILLNGDVFLEKGTQLRYHFCGRTAPSEIMTPADYDCGEHKEKEDA